MLILIPILFLFFYFVVTILFTYIPINSKFKSPLNGVDIWIVSNGVHCDIVLPIKNRYKDWTETISVNDYDKGNFRYVSFGWGDRGFYLNTPRWRDLKFKVAITALFSLGTSVMHISYLEKKPTKYKIRITPGQYKNIIIEIEKSFFDYNIIDGYGNGYDRFYKGVGRYSMFKTCNVWVNNILKRVGIKTSLWTPFDKCLLYYRK